MRRVNMFLFIALTLTSVPLEAYVGPGAGLSLLGALWGLLAAVAAALAFLLLWPLRRMQRRRREAARDEHREIDERPHRTDPEPGDDDHSPAGGQREHGRT